jgi:hypothetical protein
MANPIVCERCGHSVGCPQCEHTRQMVRLSKPCERCADEKVIAEAARQGLMEQPYEGKAEVLSEHSESMT